MFRCARFFVYGLMFVPTVVLAIIGGIVLFSEDETLLESIEDARDKIRNA